MDLDSFEELLDLLSLLEEVRAVFIYKYVMILILVYLHIFINIYGYLQIFVVKSHYHYNNPQEEEVVSDELMARFIVALCVYIYIYICIYNYIICMYVHIHLYVYGHKHVHTIPSGRRGCF
jgi:phosphatidylglycerophosphatase A